MYEKPDLALVDAVIGNLDHKIGWKPAKFNQMIFSDDMVAADAVASKILGADPKNVKHLNLAQDIGLGTMDFNRTEVKILE